LDYRILVALVLAPLLARDGMPEQFQTAAGEINVEPKTISNR